MDYIRAWKDPVYRASLNDDERAALPPSPAGFVELNDDDLDAVDGGSWTTTIPVTLAAGCFTFNSTACNGTCSIVTVGCCG